MNIKKWLFFKSNRVYLLTLKYNCRLLFRIYYQHVNVSCLLLQFIPSGAAAVPHTGVPA